jgi:hypothetical protein
MDLIDSLETEFDIAVSGPTSDPLLLALNDYLATNNEEHYSDFKFLLDQELSSPVFEL